jgi:integrase
MDHQRPHYLKLKGKTYYYSRRVPKELQQYSKTPRFETCLHTPCRNRAEQQAALLTQELDDQWSILRRRSRNELIGRLFGTAVSKVDPTASAKDSAAPSLSDAVETYVKLKGAGRSQTFEAGARRSTGYLIHICGDKRIDTFVRSDANAFRDYLKGRGLSKDSISRNFTNVRAIVNFVLREEGLQPTSVFSGVYLGEGREAQRRYVPSMSELSTLSKECRASDDDQRWLLALILDTGMRLSEAAGLSWKDVDLLGRIPSVNVRPNDIRRLKSASSERLIPLTGMSLWAVTQAYNNRTENYVFPRYASAVSLSANSASAALNKWLKKNINDLIVVHSLRHAMRDRLRTVECPVEIIDSICGWSRPGTGEAYGSGYQLQTKLNWLQKVVISKSYMLT